MSDEDLTIRRLCDACRSDNKDLLEEILEEVFKSSPESKITDLTEHSRITDLLNNSTDPTGNSHLLHIAASAGAYEVLDRLTCQVGLEVDPLDKWEQDTPLHKAVRWINGLDKHKKEELGEERIMGVVDILLEAGCDPRARNKAKLKPYDLVDPRNIELRSFLQKAEFSKTAMDDVVQEDDEGPTGSGSESD